MLLGGDRHDEARRARDPAPDPQDEHHELSPQAGKPRVVRVDVARPQPCLIVARLLGEAAASAQPASQARVALQAPVVLLLHALPEYVEDEISEALHHARRDAAAEADHVLRDEA